jgi:hypothetical protein
VMDKMTVGLLFSEHFGFLSPILVIPTANTFVSNNIIDDLNIINTDSVIRCIKIELHIVIIQSDLPLFVILSLLQPRSPTVWEQNVDFVL